MTKRQYFSVITEKGYCKFYSQHKSRGTKLKSLCEENTLTLTFCQWESSCGGGGGKESSLWTFETRIQTFYLCRALLRWELLNINNQKIQCVDDGRKRKWSIDLTFNGIYCKKYSWQKYSLTQLSSEYKAPEYKHPNNNARTEFQAKP